LYPLLGGLAFRQGAKKALNAGVMTQSGFDFCDEQIARLVAFSYSPILLLILFR
jgi:hypothetical protein